MSPKERFQFLRGMKPGGAPLPTPEHFLYCEALHERMSAILTFPYIFPTATGGLRFEAAGIEIEVATGPLFSAVCDWLPDDATFDNEPDEARTVAWLRRAAARQLEYT